MEEANLKECKYCIPKEGVCYGESLKTDFNQIETRIDGVGGYLDIRGNKLCCCDESRNLQSLANYSCNDER